MLSGFKLVAIAVLLFAPLGTSAGLKYRQDDPQTSLTLDPRVIQPSGGLTGAEANTDPSQIASLTSNNNFINFCLTQAQDVPLTDGQQKTNGSCNPIPMGRIAAKGKFPSAKFIFPVNFDASLKADQAFTIKLGINKLITGLYVNVTAKYFSAPQTVDKDGLIEGHSHVVIQTIPSLNSTLPLDPDVFVFFKAINTPATDGVLSTGVPLGLPAGAYRICSINASVNHQPVLVAVAQHGSLDDCVYFTVNPGDNSTSTSTNSGGYTRSITTTSNLLIVFVGLVWVSYSL